MPVLSFPAWLYAGIMSWRQAAYTRNLLKRWRPPAPCISVGNIRWGGTGKTPFCQWLLHWAEKKNLKSALLTRGYKAAPPDLPYLVGQDSTAVHSGDEPLLLARSAPTARIVVDPKRIRSGPWVWKQGRPDLFILDDGFQHLAVIRDLNLVLLLPEDLGRDWARTIPQGPWREGPLALVRADAFCIKAGERDAADLQQAIKTRLAPMGKPVFFFSPRPRSLTNLKTNEEVQSLGRPYLLVSGVAHPTSVEQTTRDLLATPPCKHLAFADHHTFLESDIQGIIGQAQAMNAADIVCTAKDAVKIAPMLNRNSAALSWWRLDMDLAFGQPAVGELDFEHWLEMWWEKNYSMFTGSRSRPTRRGEVRGMTRSSEP